MNEKLKKREETVPAPVQHTESDNAGIASANYTAVKMPAAFQSQWQQPLNDTVAKIQNRKPFSYDINGDALYDQYKNQYIAAGKQAMEDTIGKASAMTGGYGNSYAAVAGNQAYQGYLGKINDVIPELYKLALDRYTAEGDELYKQYSLLSDRVADDYGMWRDSVDDYRYDTEWQYQRERDAVDDARNAEERAYTKDRDTIADKRQAIEDAITLGTQVGDTSTLKGMGYDTTFLDAKNNANASGAYLNNQYLSEQLELLEANAETEEQKNAISLAEQKAALGDYTELARLLKMPVEQVEAFYTAKGDNGGYTAGDVYAAIENIKNGEWDASDANAIIAAYGEDKLNELIDGSGGPSQYGSYTQAEFNDKMRELANAYGVGDETALARAQALVDEAGGTDEAKAAFKTFMGETMYEQFASERVVYTADMKEVENKILSVGEFMKNANTVDGKVYRTYTEYIIATFENAYVTEQITEDEFVDLLIAHKLGDEYDK